MPAVNWSNSLTDFFDSAIKGLLFPTDDLLVLPPYDASTLVLQAHMHLNSISSIFALRKCVLKLEHDFRAAGAFATVKQASKATVAFLDADPDGPIDTLRLGMWQSIFNQPRTSIPGPEQGFGRIPPQDTEQALQTMSDICTIVCLIYATDLHSN